MRSKETLGLSFALSIVQHELSLCIEEGLARLNLTLPQYTALACLEEGKPTTNAELARKSSVTPQTMNGIMQNLERDGFVTKRAHPEHGLKQEFVLTAKAKRVVCKAHTEVHAMEVKMVKSLSPKRLREFQEILSDCRENLGKAKNKEL